VVIYLIFEQYTKHRMQITQERWEYDLMTHFVNFMQQMTSPLSEGEVVLVAIHCSPPT